MGRWKFFTDDETVGMHDEVVRRLDEARALCRFPIRLTCGFRTADRNAAIGGAPGSSHPKGLAADLASPVGQEEREALIWALGFVGFPRIELCPRHIHVDLDPDKTSPLWFTGPDK